ncbi:hypothetical protein SEA_MORGANA_136 [Gordonia phage Morgana]|uniref:Uncharacterized protein n=1 Tax=Gordonia phage Morgana TaxID=3137292 RepID=A0AAX4RB00_9CAUD
MGQLAATAPRPLGTYRDLYLDCAYNRADPELSRSIDQAQSELACVLAWDARYREDRSDAADQHP